MSLDALLSLRFFISLTPRPVFLLPFALKLPHQLSTLSVLPVSPLPTPVRFLLRPCHWTVLVEVTNDPPGLDPTLAASTHDPSHLFEILPSLACMFYTHTFVPWAPGPLHFLFLLPGIPFFGFLQGSCAHSFKSMLRCCCLKEAFPGHIS